MQDDNELRTHLVKLLAWSDAHATFDDAVSGVEAPYRGVVPPGWDYSAWQIVEHIRLAQEDILAFCIAAQYTPMEWPEDYWPKEPVPPHDAAWRASIDGYRRDLARVRELAADHQINLLAIVPHGKTQTYLRELLLIADHTAYHVGQLIALRKQLGIWRS